MNSLLLYKKTVQQSKKCVMILEMRKLFSTLWCFLIINDEIHIRKKVYMNNTTKIISQAKVIPMIKDISYSEREELAKALMLGGIVVLNISQQSDDGLELLRYYSDHFSNFICGGGNVQTVGEARNAIEAGAKFILSPLFDHSMVELCQNNGIPIYPVITDSVASIASGIETVGIFPIEKLGGLEMVERLYDQAGITSIVAGGIDDESVHSYLSSRAVIAVTGSWMIKREHVANKAYDKIAIACQKTLLVADM